MKLEIMAKNVVVGDVLVKGAHKYEVLAVEKIMYTDLVEIKLKTIKTHRIRNMEVASTEFVKIEQIENLSVDELVEMARSGNDDSTDKELSLEEVLELEREEAEEKRDLEFRQENEEIHETYINKEAAAEPVEDPVKLVNLYIETCKEEIEKIKPFIVNAVDEDEKLFQKGRMKCKREELTFLENRKSEILSKQETVLPTNPVTKTPLMAKLITVGDVISKGRHKYEVTNIKEYGDTITLFYSTIGTKNKIVRFMEVPPTHFITVYENVG